MVGLARHLGLGMVILSLGGVGAACSSTAASGGADDPSGHRHHGKSAPEAEGDAGESADEGPATPDLPLPRAGVKGAENRSMSAEVSLTLETSDGSTGGMSDKSFSLAEDRRVLVEAVGDRAVTKISVLYGKRETKGLEGWTSLPTQNNGYSVEGDGGSPRILQDGKHAAAPDEAKVVAAEYGYVGSANPLLVAIERSKGGEAQSLDPAGQIALFGYNPEITIKEATVTFGSSDEVNGRSTLTIEVSLKGSLPDGSLSYDFDLAGPAQIDATTGWVTDLSLQGSLVPSGKVKVKGRELKASGKGKVQMKRTSKIE